VSADNAYNRNYNKRMQEELAEFNTPRARYQRVLDRHWEAQRDLEFDEEADDFYMVGGFMEKWSQTPSYTKSKRDRDWRIK
jgi:hypothetical protein